MTMHIGKKPGDKTKRASEPIQNSQGGTRNTTSYLRELHALGGTWGLSQLDSESVSVEGHPGGCGNAQTHIFAGASEPGRGSCAVSRRSHPSHPTRDPGLSTALISRSALGHAITHRLTALHLTYVLLTLVHSQTL
jgi:hypothetical protein